MITESCIKVRGTCHPIADVTRASYARGHSTPSAHALLVAAACVAVIGVGAVVAVDGVVQRCLVAAIVACVAVGLAGGALYAWHTRPYELWIRSQRGQWESVYSGRDPVEFGKVKRVVRRAMDDAADPYR